MATIGKDGKLEDGQVPSADERDPRADNPEEWAPFFRRGLNQVKSFLREREKKSLGRGLKTKDELRELYAKIRRGDETRAFLASKFWNDHLIHELARSENPEPWKPGDSKTIEHAAMDHIFASGQAARVKELMSTFETWVREGDDSRKAVEKDSELRKRISEVG